MASKQTYKLHMCDVKFAKKLADTYVLNVDEGVLRDYSETDY